MSAIAAGPRQTKFVLDESRIPRSWYNIAADLPEPAPPVLHPGTGQPIGPGDLAPLFPMELIKQVVSTEREIEIPDEVREAYALYRPSPLYRAHRLEKALDTPAHIYYKYEGGSPSGSHKPNTALPQAFYNKAEGVTRMATETGAGQWGSALAFAGSVFGLDVKVFMVRASYDQKPYRRILMETYGAEVVPSPSPDTQYGRKVLEATPDNTGSLGIAISEAIEDTVSHPGTKYSLGSVFDFVLLHQTVIGQESIEQMGMAGEEPDVIIGCAGGGSNFAGLTFPWLGRTFRGGRKYRVIAAEPEAAPSLTRGTYTYDFGDTAQMTPLIKMHTLGHDFIPEPIHAGGLRYHGMSPLVSLLKEGGHIEAQAVHQRSAFEVGVQFARAEGILPAPEPTHAIRAAVDEALAAREAGEARVILFNLCGHGHFDLSAYERYLDGTLEDYEYPREKVEAALAGLPAVG
ncbi:MAG TPA: TrpB-like pyridoxal phosphate-dependent enzyme [Patescibacteria group bacterium]|jgi:tryptophan synthase beta chain|nr:TrpB-like pyridoxal phosphate-dependent enzyme [Patescibacteria group bacterium]